MESLKFLMVLTLVAAVSAQVAGDTTRWNGHFSNGMNSMYFCIDNTRVGQGIVDVQGRTTVAYSNDTESVVYGTLDTDGAVLRGTFVKAGTVNGQFVARLTIQANGALAGLTAKIWFGAGPEPTGETMSTGEYKLVSTARPSDDQCFFTTYSQELSAIGQFSDNGGAGNFSICIYRGDFFGHYSRVTNLDPEAPSRRKLFDANIEATSPFIPGDHWYGSALAGSWYEGDEWKGLFLMKAKSATQVWSVFYDGKQKPLYDGQQNSIGYLYPNQEYPAVSGTRLTQEASIYACAPASTLSASVVVLVAFVALLF
jgi:hypothetical protein